MPQGFHRYQEGPIDGLRLPPNAWDVLRRENITTLDRLKAVARRIERFDGIGSKTARAIREEVARATCRDEQPGGQH
jgi:hypothetical protein